VAHRVVDALDNAMLGEAEKAIIIAYDGKSYRY
jgi:hypothetical protein